MNANTHIILNSHEELEESYRDYQEQFEDNLIQCRTQFNQGKNILQCNTVGVIYLADEIRPDSHEGKNPYQKKSEPKAIQKEELLDFQPETESTPQQSEGVPTSARRQRIDAILKVIDYEGDPNQVTLLMKVFDLEDEFEDQMTMSQILALKE